VLKKAKVVVTSTSSAYTAKKGKIAASMPGNKVPKAVAMAAAAADAVHSTRWRGGLLARLVNAIVMMKEDFIARDASPDRLEIDEKSKDYFWHLLAKLFNDDTEHVSTCSCMFAIKLLLFSCYEFIAFSTYIRSSTKSS
jgi:hypothetical protein